MQAIVDDEDFDGLTVGRSWHAAYRPSGWYACQRVDRGGKQLRIYMHREIMGLNGGDRRVLVDHINRNPLDNRRENLRLTDHQGNGANRGRESRANPTGLTGVRGAGSLWYFTLRYKKVNYRVSRFPTAIAAADARAELLHKLSTDGEKISLALPNDLHHTNHVVEK